MIDIGAEDFVTITKELGKKITFENNGQSTFADVPNEQGISQYASITPNRANKAIGTAEGEYLYTGMITFDSYEQQTKLRGCYFTFDNVPTNKYFLVSTFFEGFTPNVAMVSCAACNEKISIVSHYKENEEKDEFGRPIGEPTPIYIAQDIPVYMTMFNKEAKDTAGGGLPETVGYISMPARYTISTNNIIEKNGFTFNKATNQNEYKKLKYKVESIDTSLTDVYNGELFGSVKFLLKEE